MKLKMCDNTAISLCLCVLFTGLTLLGAHGCSVTAETERQAIKAGLEQKQDIGKAGYHWEKAK
jgi:hypothetical protein